MVHSTSGELSPVSGVTIKLLYFSGLSGVLLFLRGLTVFFFFFLGLNGSLLFFLTAWSFSALLSLSELTVELLSLSGLFPLTGINWGNRDFSCVFSVVRDRTGSFLFLSTVIIPCVQVHFELKSEKSPRLPI